MPYGTFSAKAKMRLEIRDLSLQVHLGCTQQERTFAQEIRVSVDLLFKEAPPACRIDELNGTLCFSEICDVLRRLYTQKGCEFQTVERMLQLGVEKLSQHLPGSVEFSLKIHKVRPPVEGLLGGAYFELEHRS